MFKRQSICSICKESNLDCPEVFCMLISRFPAYLRERENRKVLYQIFIRRRHALNDPIFFKWGVKFFAETISGGRRSELRRVGRRQKNFKKGRHNVNF